MGVTSMFCPGNCPGRMRMGSCPGWGFVRAHRWQTHGFCLGTGMGFCLGTSMDGVLPGHRDGVLPGHMDGVLPGHLNGNLEECMHPCVGKLIEASKSNDCKTPSRCPHPSARAKPHPDARSKPHPDAWAKPHPDTRAKPHPDTRANPHPDVRAKPHPEAQAKSHPEARAKPHPGPQAMPGQNLRHDRSPFPFCPGKKNRGHTHTTPTSHPLSGITPPPFSFAWAKAGTFLKVFDGNTLPYTGYMIT